MTWSDLIDSIKPAERDRLMRWYSKMSDKERIDVHKLQTDLMRRHRNKAEGISPHELSYSMLFLALAKRHHFITSAERKESLTPAQAEQLSKIRVDAISRNVRGRKGRLDSAYRVRLAPIVEQLRVEKDFSWRQISEYLAKWHKIKISHEYLRKLYQNVSQEREA